jgi:hypothetical protein
MKRLSPDSDPIQTFKRKAVATRRIGHNNRCECGETRVEALVPRRKPTICVTCQRKAKGHSTMDNHHVAGKSNSDVTVKIPASDHRSILSTAQYEWPKETLENPDNCPLRRAAARIRGFIDTILYLIDELLEWTAKMLESLSDFLKQKLGPQWWLNTPIAKFSQQTKRPRSR